MKSCTFMEPVHFGTVSNALALQPNVGHHLGMLSFLKWSRARFYKVMGNRYYNPNSASSRFAIMPHGVIKLPTQTK